MQFAIAQKITCPQVLIQKHLIRLLSGSLLLIIITYMSFSIAFLAVYFIRKQHTALILNHSLQQLCKRKNKRLGCHYNTCNLISKLRFSKCFFGGCFFFNFVFNLTSTHLGTLLNQHPQPLANIFVS